MEGSPKYHLNKEDGKRIGKGALVALVGALLVYATDTIPQVDFGTLTPLVAAGFAVLANIVRVWIADNA